MYTFRRLWTLIIKSSGVDFSTFSNSAWTSSSYSYFIGLILPSLDKNFPKVPLSLKCSTAKTSIKYNKPDTASESKSYNAIFS